MSEDMLNVMGSFISTELDAFENLHKELEERDKEIERLNNIINELEEYIKWQRKCSLSLNNGFTVSRLDVVLNKLQELKGDDKNDKS